LLAGVFAGFTVCLIKKLRNSNGPIVIYLYFWLLGVVVSFPMFIADPVISQSGLEWLMAGGILIFLSIIPLQLAPARQKIGN